MSENSFQLHPQLKADTYVVGHFRLCMLLLAKDANYPWCIMVPKIEGVREIHHLSADNRQALLTESCVLAESMEALFKPLKMNIAALGNIVPQLHIHHIARFEADAAWPAPIWGKVPAKKYNQELLDQRLNILRQQLLNSQIGFES
jgi:diadenosine tetraphosphate (Ap4A) HIT family hydrolase